MDNRMIEEGVVVEVFDGMAKVRAVRGSSCEGCASKSMCKPGDAGSNTVIEAKNILGAHIGERVEVAMQPKLLLKASFITYIVPLISFVAGAAIGKGIGGAEALGGGWGFLSLFLCYGGIWMYNKKALREGKYQPEIVTVLSS